MTEYLIYSISALGVSYCFYRLFLKKEKSFNFNRVYLLSSLILCLIAPSLEINWGSTLIPVNKTIFDTEVFDSLMIENPESNSVLVLEKQLFSFRAIALYFYLLVSCIFILRFCRNLYMIFRLIKSSPTKFINNVPIREIQKRGDPFSFFGYLFINNKDIEDSAYSETVITHELAHSRQLHSADIIFIEILTCVYWCNPFLWLYKREILENHEFLADAEVIKKGIDPREYSGQLIRNGDRARQTLFSGFSFVKTKNRLIMIHKAQSSKFQIIFKAALTLALFSLVFAISSYSPVKDSIPFVVVVDAGHGGIDTGSFNEKDINLQISKHLAALSRKGEVEIILIRDKDEFLNIEERKRIIRSHNPDLFISLHCNSSTNAQIKGIEAYYPATEENNELSFNYSKILINEHLNQITDKGEIKTANFLLLRDNPFPGILLHLGYLTNENDSDRLNDRAHQRLVAQSIYNGLLKIKGNRK